jgi:hypothetical protein
MLVWQALASPAHAHVFEMAHDLDHALLHLTSEPHHHDDQGDIRIDGSIDSQRHIVADACHSSPFLAPTGWTCFPNALPPSPALTDDILGPDPYLQGIKRPPR